MAELVAELARRLVDEPGAVRVEEVEEEEPARLRPGLTRPVPRPSGASAMQAEPGGRE